MEETDKEILDATNMLQEKIDNSGVGLMSVETTDPEVLAAISRIFGVNTNQITFDMFKQAVRGLTRVGMIKGYQSA